MPEKVQSEHSRSSAERKWQECVRFRPPPHHLRKCWRIRYERANLKRQERQCDNRNEKQPKPNSHFALPLTRLSAGLAFFATGDACRELAARIASARSLLTPSRASIFAATLANP